jgi:hypothetical protein
MIISRCHRDTVDVIDYSNESYYVCQTCGMACETLSALSLEYDTLEANNGDMAYDDAGDGCQT